jgi:hypothetical protein
MQRAAETALGANKPQPQQQRVQQQQGDSGAVCLQLLGVTQEDALLEQLLVWHMQQQGLVHPAASALVSGAAGSNGGSNGRCAGLTPLQAACMGDSATRLLLAVLAWQCGMQGMQLAGVIPALHGVSLQMQQQQQQEGSTTNVGVCGLSLMQMLLLVQSQGPCLPSLLLLDSMTLLFTQQQQLQQMAVLQGLQGLQGWSAVLTVLQNAVTAAVVPGRCNWQYTAAAVRCLAALYAAAGACFSYSSTSDDAGVEAYTASNPAQSVSAASVAAAAAGAGSAAAAAVLKSPWNGPVLQAALDRLCQTGMKLKAVAVAAMAAEAAAAAGSSGTPRLSYRCDVGEAW